MNKNQALVSLGQRGLLLPVWVKAALLANDRLKLYLTVLQAACVHAEHAHQGVMDLSRELAAAGITSGSWLLELVAGASRIDDALLVPDLERLLQCLHDDLVIMARPVLESTTNDAEPHLRVRHWLDWLAALKGEQLDVAQLRSLTHGKRADGDSLHILIMDLHKQINRLAADLASEEVDGAHVWLLHDEDRPLVSAFMRGLHRTAMLKLDHPGLDTAATRDGDRLMLQNDIGTNDAHVLVIQVQNLAITLTYSDLHRSRFAFFQAQLTSLGARWSTPESRVSADLNQGVAYTVGTATFDCPDDEGVATALEGIGARIVFLIDWNRARKRLQAFIGKSPAIAVLTEAARLEIGHMAWLKAGGEQLIYRAMEAAGEGAFRIGDRLDAVLGEANAQAFLLDVMRLSCKALLNGQPLALVADETRMLLTRQVQKRGAEFDLLDEHAAYCQTLAQAVSDALSHRHDGLRDVAQDLAARAKVWERRADHLVMQARDEAARQPRWQPAAQLMGLSDDVADALEEAAFLISLIADHHQKGWNGDVRQALSRLAQTVLQSTQDHVKALTIARTLGAGSDAADNDAFLDALWAVLHAERQCDELLRHARRTILRVVDDAPSLMLVNDLAQTLELASDRLLVAGYRLRELVFTQTGITS
ncbi:MAG: phosphate transport regulator [Burkholderiales bacterium]|nr:phosphate transport regulator [Burkholderiales bacterium]